MASKAVDIKLPKRCPHCGQFWNIRTAQFPHCPKMKAAYEASLVKWDKKMKPLIDAIKRSRQITADDLAIIVR